MIYFIQCGENGPIKIGQSDNPEERMAQLQTACPYELKMLWVYKNSDWTEIAIHGEFSHERIRGEWYHPSQSILSFIEEVLVNSYAVETFREGEIFIYEHLSGELRFCLNDVHCSIKGSVFEASGPREITKFINNTGYNPKEDDTP